MTGLATSAQGVGHRGRWKWFLALGGVLVVLGIAGASVASVLDLTSVLVFGPFLLASSLAQFVTAFLAEQRKERLLHIAAAAVELIVGFLIMAHPPERVVQVIGVIVAFLIVSGLLRLARSLTTPSRGRAWTVMTGVIALLLGIALWVGGPAAKMSLVGLCIAIDFFCHGLSWSALALAERGAADLEDRLVEQPQAPAPGSASSPTAPT
jgi:uncharacterized membrane protein HdeD (DUF308 family)